MTALLRFVVESKTNRFHKGREVGVGLAKIAEKAALCGKHALERRTSLKEAAAINWENIDRGGFGDVLSENTGVLSMSALRRVSKEVANVLGSCEKREVRFGGKESG